MFNRLRPYLSRLWSRPGNRWLFGVPVGGFVMLGVGGIGGVGMLEALELTNRTEFCISCHEMRETVYQEYKESLHYSNKSGVRATCADCHVPRELGPKLVRKAASAKEVYAKVTGRVDTIEKFEARRWELAESVWATMRANDSKACRNCHSYESMRLKKQDRVARARHDPERVQEEGKTCIDCHQGLVHKEPKRPSPPST